MMASNAERMFADFYDFYKIYFIDEANLFTDDIERIQKSMIPEFSPFLELQRQFLRSRKADVIKQFSDNAGAAVKQILSRAVKFAFNGKNKQPLPDLNQSNQSQLPEQQPATALFLGNIGGSKLISQMFIQAKIDQQQFVDRNIGSS